MEITVAVKDAFFDRAAVIRRMDTAKQKRLSKAGAFLQRRAQSLLKRRKKTSQAGQTPSIHTEKGAEGPGSGLKYILFFYDSAADSVVVGPVKLNQATMVDGNRSSVPELMEKGGIATIYEERWRFPRKQFKWRRRDLRRLPNPEKEYRRRRAVYRPRPFMGPALDKERQAGKIPELFKNCIGP
jgi:hypothetical protein